MSKRIPISLLVLLVSLVVFLDVLMLASGLGIVEKILLRFGLIGEGYRIGTWVAILVQFFLNGIALTLVVISYVKAAKARIEVSKLQWQVHRLREAVEYLDSSQRKIRSELKRMSVSPKQAGAEVGNQVEGVRALGVQVLPGDEEGKRDAPYSGDRMDPEPERETRSQVIVRREVEHLFLDLCQRCEKGRELIERFRQGVVQSCPDAVVFSVFRDGGVGWSSLDFTTEVSNLRAPLEYLAASDASGAHWLFPCPHKAGFNFADLTGFKIEGGDQNDRRKLREFSAGRLNKINSSSFAIPAENGGQGRMMFG